MEPILTFIMQYELSKGKSCSCYDKCVGLGVDENVCHDICNGKLEIWIDYVCQDYVKKTTVSISWNNEYCEFNF